MSRTWRAEELIHARAFAAFLGKIATAIMRDALMDLGLLLRVERAVNYELDHYARTRKLQGWQVDSLRQQCWNGGISFDGLTFCQMKALLEKAEETFKGQRSDA